jgi:hypothetical protein
MNSYVEVSPSFCLSINMSSDAANIRVGLDLSAWQPNTPLGSASLGEVKFLSS